MQTTINNRMHFCLGKRDNDWTGMAVTVNGRKYPLEKHNEHTLKQAVLENNAIAFLAENAREKITAYADLDSDAIHRQSVNIIMVQEEITEGKLPVLHHFSYWIPEKYHRLARQNGRNTRQNTEKNNALSGICAKMQFLEAQPDLHEMAAKRKGFSTFDIEAINRDAHYLMTDMDTAASILFTHAELGSNKPYTAAVVMDEAIMPDREIDPDQFYQMYLFAREIERQGPDNWAVRDVARDYQGKPVLCQYDALGYHAGDQIEIYQLSTNTLNAAKKPASGALQLAKNNERLQNTNWTVAIGNPVEREMPKAMTTAGGIQWTADKKGSHHGLEMIEDKICFQNGKLSLAVKNHFMRTLGAYAQFFNDAGKGIANPKGWEEKLSGEDIKKYETDEKKYMGLVTPVNSIMGIPFPAQETAFTFCFPDDATKVRLLFGTLGLYGYDEDFEINKQGAMLTGVFQLAIPALLLTAATLVPDGQTLIELAVELSTVIINIVIAVTGADGTESVDAERIISILGDAIVGILLQKGVEKLVLYLTGMITAQQLAQQIPIAGWALKIFNLTVGAAALAVTTGEIISSPATLQIEVSRTTDLQLTLHPDPTHGEAGKPETAVWPLIADNYKILLTYEGGTNRELTGKVKKGNQPICVTFSGIPAGGKCKVCACLYSKEDWLCGLWEGDWIKALPDSGSGIRLDASIVEQIIPLDGSTQYNLIYNKTYENGTYCWREKHEIPKDTIDVLDDGGYQDALCKLLNLSLNEAKQWVGYTYRASGTGLPDTDGTAAGGNEALAQGMSKIGDGAVRSSLCEKGFKQDVLFALDKYGDGSDNYLLDPDGSTYKLRKIDLDQNDFDLNHSREVSYGTFHLQSIDAMAVHPDRKVIATSWKQSLVEIIDLKAGETNGNDSDGIMMCGQGTRQGLLHGPKAMTVTADGRILILESTNHRIQAFDSSMNPVQCFIGDGLASGIANCIPQLNKSSIPEALTDCLRQAGDTLAGKVTVDDGIWQELSDLIISETLLSHLADTGIYPASGKDAQTGQWKYLSLAKDKQKDTWLLHDKSQELSWKLCRKNNLLEAERILDHLLLRTVTPGTEWVLQDTEMARSYQIICTDEKKQLVSISRKESYIPLRENGECVWLDLAAEEKGYIYVLYYRNGGHTPEDYLIDIYTPEGKWLVQIPDTSKHPGQPHIVAGKLDIDHFRTLFAMHFENEKGNNGRREPKLTQWIPSAPK